MFGVARLPSGKCSSLACVSSRIEFASLPCRVSQTNHGIFRDQELRFTVHDSPDYYQLKLSVFTDDKKTDLIGESWIDLKGIIVPGGGQNDMWQGLTCRGKYAGEIRIEITYYDTRPRPEKPVAKQRQQAVTTEQDATAPMKQRTPVKRRPLPSDPVTGEAPVTPPVAIASQPEVHQTTPRSHSKSASHAGFIPNQSPLQSVEYNTPPPHPQGSRQPAEQYTPSPHSAHRHGHRSRESHGTPTRYPEDRGYSQRGQPSPYDQPDPRSTQSSFSEIHELPEDLGGAQPAFDDDAPPPPPAHRSRQNSAGPELTHRGSYDISPQKSPMPMRKDVLKSEAHRHSIAAYPGQPVFKAYDPASSAPIPIAGRNDSPYESPSSRYQAHSPSYAPQHRSMQPTVEDVPESPTASYGRSTRAAAYQNEMAFDAPNGQMPQSLSRSPGTPQYMSEPPSYGNEHQDRGAYPSSVSPLSVQDYSNTSSQVSYASQPGHHQRPSRHSDFEPVHTRNAHSYGPPVVPPSLSPGVDLALSQEFADRRYDDRGYDDRRYEARYIQQDVATPPRGRHRSEGPPLYSNSPHSYTPQSHDGRAMVTYNSRHETQPARPRNSPSPNPNPQHTIRRKSVSPAPPPAENRRQSGIPFGPDSYDAFNPSMGSPGASAPDPTAERADPNGKIISHDGREIDPSDHLPMDTWAPEPEPKKQASPEPRARPSPSGAQPMPPSGRRPLRIAARSDPVITQQQALPPPLPTYGQAEDPRTPPHSGRNRLQKKARGSAGHNSLPPPASSPLAPISPDNYQERQAQYTPTRGAHRGSPYDYPNENHAPQYYGSGPPIPAKIPLPVMSGANGGGEMALMEEMQRIDIGAGRSRRRGGY